MAEEKTSIKAEPEAAPKKRKPAEPAAAPEPSTKKRKPAEPAAPVALQQAIAEAQKQQRLLIGSRTATKALKEGKLVRVAAAQNCPSGLRRDLEHWVRVSNIEFAEFPGDSLLLGEACGKPFGVLVVGFKK